MFTTLTKKEFERYKEQGFNRIPLVLESFADLDTPLSVYAKLANQPYSYLFYYNILSKIIDNFFSYTHLKKVYSKIQNFLKLNFYSY